MTCALLGCINAGARTTSRDANYRDSRGQSSIQAQGIPPSANSDAQRGLAPSAVHCDCHAGLQSQSCQLTQGGGVAVGDAANHGRDATPPLGQPFLFPIRKRSTSLGDRVPVRIRFRVSQLRGDPIFEPLRYEVLEAFRLIVDLVPRVVEEIMEETLQQAVMAKNLQSAPLPVGG